MLLLIQCQAPGYGVFNIARCASKGRNLPLGPAETRTGFRKAIKAIKNENISTNGAMTASATVLDQLPVIMALISRMKKGELLIIHTNR